MNIKVDLAAIKKHRKSLGMSISMVSDHLGYKTPTGYWLIEKGERKASIEVLYMLAKLFKVHMEDLIIEA